MSAKKINKQQGTTEAERYLARLCERTFLSLWSYPNVSRDVFVPGTAVGKEVCDLLVVFQDHILIFSDKDCAVPRTGDLSLDWSRWLRKAVVASAKQAHGAERWLREFPERLFLDRECQQPLPLTPRISERTRFHLLVVAHNISKRCREELGGSGSLMILSDLKGHAAHSEPFLLGDLDPSKSFVHVLDDTTLNVLMTELDTIADFVAYLDKKEKLLRSGVSVFAAGEEELLARYLRTMKNGTHDFRLPEGSVEGIVLPEGHYIDYLRNPQRKAKVRANRVSYAWDRLIKTFSFHILEGTQYFTPPGGLTDSERILRWLAREPRVRRRMLARQLVECVQTTRPDQRRTAIIPPSHAGDPYYVFLLVPWNESRTKEENRAFRKDYLTAACKVLRLMKPDAIDIVGIATESGRDSGDRSEDAMYCDFRTWTDEMEKDAQELQESLGLLINPRELRWTEHEYPEQTATDFKNCGRNDPCPCGSGKKYKKCHGRHPTALTGRSPK